MMVKLSVAITALTAAMVSAASAEFQPVRNKEVFQSLVTGKTLTRPLIELSVTPDGQITGKGGFKPVAGHWLWQDGFFCREIVWGQRNLGYNCQEVSVSATTVRFIADKGAGEIADFGLKSK
jgi:hypothetical protein